MSNQKYMYTCTISGCDDVKTFVENVIKQTKSSFLGYHGYNDKSKFDYEILSFEDNTINYTIEYSGFCPHFTYHKVDLASACAARKYQLSKLKCNQC